LRRWTPIALSAKNFPEVIFGAGKTSEQIVKIADKLFKLNQPVLVTRIHAEHARALRKKFKQAVHHPVARCVTIEKKPLPKSAGFIAVVCAGTSDLPVAEEAAVTAEIMGNCVERVHDVGVAGLHRLLARMELLQTANVIVAVAGMEGALPSVLAGLVSRPVIARADEHWLWSELRRPRRAARHVKQLRQRLDRGEH